MINESDEVTAFGIEFEFIIYLEFIITLWHAGRNLVSQSDEKFVALCT